MKSESTISPQIGYRMPNSIRLRNLERYIVRFLLLACAILVLTLPFSFPSILSSLYAGSWFIALVFYAFLRYRWLPHLFTSGLVMWHAVIGTIAIFLLQILVQYAGYGRYGFDPHALWLLYLIPLVMVSRLGKTSQWWWTFAGITIALGIVTLLNTSFTLDGLIHGTLVINWSVLVVGACRLAFLLLIAATFHTLVRQIRQSDALLVVGRKVTNHLASQPSFENAYRDAADTIRHLHYPSIPFVFILIWDEHSQRLKIAGASGMTPELWQDIELEKGQGVTGTVFSTGESRNIPDVRREKIYYLAKGFENIRSELAVPIRYKNKMIGVLDIESPEADAFDERDQVVLEGWAESLAISFGHFLSIDEGVSNAYKLALDTIEAGNEYTSLNGWFAQVANSACSHLGANSLALLRLAPGTSYPLLPLILWPKRINKQLDNMQQIPDNSILWRLLENWEIEYWNEVNWKEWDSEDDQWVLREIKSTNAKSLVFVPVGSVNNPIAALFMVYPIQLTMGDVQRLGLLVFAAALEKSYQTLVPRPAELQRMATAVHQILVPATQKLFSELSAIQRVVQSPLDILDHLDTVEYSIRELREHIKAVTMRDRYDLAQNSVEEALKKASGDFIKLRQENLQISFTDIPSIEDEPLYTRQVLYWVIIEAISNAVEHGEASKIEVNVQQEKRTIVVEIVDNGIGMPSAIKPVSPYGIFYLKRKLRREMGAQLNFTRIEPKGTCIVLRLPVRPRKHLRLLEMIIDEEVIV